MGCHVVGIDIYVEELLKLTGGGVKAVAVFSNADAAYAGAPQIIKLGGVLMVVGLPHNPLKISSMDLVLGKYKIKSESTSIPQRMGKAIEFTAKHNIQPEVELRIGLDSLQGMIDDMKAGKSTKRVAIVF
jgi:propanol-preferring alcohol dehydrogenase